MTIRMKNLEQFTLDEMEQFLEANEKLKIEPEASESRYKLVEAVLRAQSYGKLGKGGRGIVGRFLIRVTGFSRAQMNRLIGQWQRTRQVRRKPAQRPEFACRYTKADIVLLAEVDAAHEDLSGPAVRHI